MVALNSLVLAGSELNITGAAFINDRGEIAGSGVLPNGDTRAVLLIPATPAEIAAAGMSSSRVSLAPAATTTSVPRVLRRSGFRHSGPE